MTGFYLIYDTIYCTIHFIMLKLCLASQCGEYDLIPEEFRKFATVEIAKQ